MSKYINRLTVAAILGVLGLLFVTATVSADGEGEEGEIGDAAVVYNVCRTDDGGATYYFVPDVADNELRDSDVYHGEDGYSVNGQADCDALAAPVETLDEPDPPADTDGDGFTDDVDGCVDEAEVYNDFEDGDGCPDEVPVQEETPEQTQGPVDSDGDGVTDDADQCPSEAEVYNGFEDADGCPDTAPVENDPPQGNTPPADTDGDGLTDDVDACPDLAPSVDEDKDGCEDEVLALASEGDIGTQAHGTAYTCADDPPIECETDSGGGEEECGEDTFIIKVNVGEGFTDHDTITVSDDGFIIVIDITHTKDGGEITGFTFSASGGVVYAFVKTGGADDPHVDDDEQYFNDANAVSHITFCTTGDDPEESGEITICKNTDPEGGEDFEFEPSNNVDPDDNFFLDDGQCEDFEDLDGGEQYNFEEDGLPDGWELDRIQCTGDEQSGVDINVGSERVEIDLVAGEHVTCTFYNVGSFGTITICKETDPEGGEDFEFEPSNNVDPDDNFFLDDGQCEDFEDLVADEQYRFTEVDLPDDWELDDIECEGGSDVEIGDDDVRIELAEGENVECKFYNELEGGTIVICKETDPESRTPEWEFTVNGPSIDNDIFEQHGDGDCKTYEDLDPGPYTAVETQMDGGWTLDRIDCDIDGDSTTEEIDDGVQIELAQGDRVRCTFFNEQEEEATIQICKDFVSDELSGEEEADFTGPDEFGDDGEFSLGDDECEPSDGGLELEAGQTYSFAEIVANLPDGFELTDIACTGDDDTAIVFQPSGQDTFQTGDTSVDIDLADGEDIVCTFTNTETEVSGTAQIIVCKLVEEGSDQTQEFSFTGTNGLTFATLSHDECDNTNDNLDAGSYDITETIPTAWDLVDILCETGDGSSFQYGNGSFDTEFQLGDDTARVTLTEGDIVTCTFTNEEDPASIQICKNFVGDGSAEAQAEFDVSWTSNGPIDFTLGDGECAPAEGGFELRPGPYTAEEILDSLPDGFVLTRINCQGDEESEITTNVDTGVATIDLADGEDVVCTFRNVNAPDSSIEICKEVIGPSGGQLFDFAGELDIADLGDGGCELEEELLADSYDVFENVPANFDLVDIVCVIEGESTVDSITDGVRINLAEGDFVSCTFFNQQEPPPPPAGDDDDADDDDDVSEVGGIRQPGRVSEVGGIRRGPGVGTGDGTYVPFAGFQEEGGAGVLLPALAFLAVTGLLTLAYGQWQFSRRGQRR